MTRKAFIRACAAFAGFACALPFNIPSSPENDEIAPEPWSEAIMVFFATFSNGSIVVDRTETFELSDRNTIPYIAPIEYLQ